MMKTCIPFVIVSALAVILMISASPANAQCKPDNNPLNDWDTYKKNYKKVYTPEEDGNRKKIFEANKKIIQDHNCRYEQGLETFGLGINQFTDMNPDEVPKGFNYQTTPEGYHIQLGKGYIYRDRYPFGQKYIKLLKSSS